MEVCGYLSYIGNLIVERKSEITIGAALIDLENWIWLTICWSLGEKNQLETDQRFSRIFLDIFGLYYHRQQKWWVRNIEFLFSRRAKLKLLFLYLTIIGKIFVDFSICLYYIRSMIRSYIDVRFFLWNKDCKSITLFHLILRSSSYVTVYF